MKPRKKTTIYLPDELKHHLERVARHENRPEADIIREALQTAMAERDYPEPRIPLVSYGLGAPDIAERADELLNGSGR